MPPPARGALGRTLRGALLATGAAGVVAIPVAGTFLAEAPRSEAAQGSESVALTLDLDSTVMLDPETADAQRVSATVDALAQAEVLQRAAAARAAEEQAAAERASRSRTLELEASDPRAVAQSLLAGQGQGGQFGCLDKLWTRESGWSTSADNPSSSAYGIPQALPGSKMASAGPDWRTSARTQITWGLSYIDARYGSPCAAWSHSQSHGWY